MKFVTVTVAIVDVPAVMVVGFTENITVGAPIALPVVVPVVMPPVVAVVVVAVVEGPVAVAVVPDVLPPASFVLAVPSPHAAEPTPSDKAKIETKDR